MEKRFGYHGKILHLDLTSGATSLEQPPDSFYRIYPGPALMGTWFLLRDSDPGIDAFAPGNVLTFGCGVAGGHLGTGLARFGVVAKSPLSGGVFESRGEGPFARALKGSGYDALVIRGRAGSPVYLLIDGGKVSVLPAGEIWGKNTAEATAVLEGRHGLGCSVATIGQAGEKLVRYAGIVTSGAHQTQRGGMGAVMGSKHLKAIVIRNPIFPEVAAQATLDELARLFREDGLANNALNSWQKQPPGFSYWIDVVVDPGYVASRNGQAHDYKAPPAFGRSRYQEYFRLESPCPGCANDCIKTFNTRRFTKDDRAGGASWETPAAFAINLDLGSLETFFDLNTLCMLHGLDPVSTGNVLGFAAECAERGVVTEAGLGYRFGFGEAADAYACRLVEDIATRNGLGDVLAEGVRRAAAVIGQRSEAWALHVKGVECIMIEPRCQTNLALGYAVAPNGPQGDICEHDWDYDVSVGWSHTLDRSMTLGILDRIPMGLQHPRKVRNFRALNLIWSGCDGLGICLYACAPTRYLRLEQIAQTVAAVTGWDFSSFELMQIGERRNTLMRWYNYREGLNASDDRLPERYYTEPIGTGRHAGSVINRVQFQEMIRTWYAMSGCDETGRPTRAKLYELNLDWAAEQAGQ
jgi:aldehyde:ferredoxin oxidoreductase